MADENLWLMYVVLAVVLSSLEKQVNNCAKCFGKKVKWSTPHASMTQNDWNSLWEQGDGVSMV